MGNGTLRILCLKNCCRILINSCTTILNGIDVDFIMLTDTVGCATPETCMEVCGSRSGCSNIAYPSLVIDLMPAG